ncbi:hypothetical protein [Thermosporothrix hazakensis]|jgi:hypothetical protein|nr:hypothetical protein [Thermosporothrix hazakensis]
MMSEGQLKPAIVLKEAINVGNTEAAVTFSICFQQIPADGAYSLFVPGPDARNTIQIPLGTLPPTSKQSIVSFQVRYPAQFTTHLELSYWFGTTIPPCCGKIDVTVSATVEKAARFQEHILLERSMPIQ